MSRLEHFVVGSGRRPISSSSKDHFGEVDTQAPGYWEAAKPAGWVTVHPGDSLIATQKELDPQHPAFTGKKVPRGAAPSLVASSEGTYISDGHHRIAAARLQGRSIKARLHVVQEEEW